MKVLSIVGHSNSGKTTLIEKLIPELKKRGFSVGVIKHTHHGFDIDKPGKDTWKHRKAGADIVMAASPDTIAIIKETGSEVPLDGLLTYMNGLDLVITEGYKRENKSKIEVFRKDSKEPPLFLGSKDLIAFVSDTSLSTSTPLFHPDNIDGITDFIEKYILS